jgi:hypothetical protein
MIYLEFYFTFAMFFLLNNSPYLTEPTLLAHVSSIIYLRVISDYNKQHGVEKRVILF